jgi:hypothetical protein
MEDIDKLIQLAAKTGRLYVAEDIFTELISYADKFLLHKIHLVKSAHLPKGSVVAIDTNEYWTTPLLTLS